MLHLAADRDLSLDERRRERWDPQTPESFEEIVAILDAARASGDAKELEELELMCGVNRQPNGVLWDPYLRRLLRMPHAMYWDSMHCKFASGGLAQFLVNGIAFECTRNNLTLDDLDVFTQSCKGHK